MKQCIVTRYAILWVVFTTLLPLSIFTQSWEIVYSENFNNAVEVDNLSDVNHFIQGVNQKGVNFVLENIDSHSDDFVALPEMFLSIQLQSHLIQ